jgi:hypothetical protein
MSDTPQTPPVRQPLLPGMAMICVFLLLIAMINAFAALRGQFAGGTATRYSIFGVCTLMILGVFGLLRLKRWGWSIVTAGCVLMAAGYFFLFVRTHVGPYLVQGLFDMLFFLYLSRTEVRERLRS